MGVRPLQITVAEAHLRPAQYLPLETGFVIADRLPAVAAKRAATAL